MSFLVHEKLELLTEKYDSLINGTTAGDKVDIANMENVESKGNSKKCDYLQV